MSAAGTERVVHSFGGGADGEAPFAGLVDANGVLYGTTAGDGKYGSGTAFAMTVAGTERILHNVGDGTDGASPQAALIDVNGVLYGTTVAGGKNNDGTVFALTTAGSERVLRSFGFCHQPIGGLIDVNGLLYGTTAYGGTSLRNHIFLIAVTYTLQDEANSPGGSYASSGVNRLRDCAAELVGRTGLFRAPAIPSAGAFPLSGEGTLYSFPSGADANPEGGLVNVNGVLYGTTCEGGIIGPHPHGPGTVFAVNASRTERVLHRFGSGADGNCPLDGLLDMNGVLYGTTLHGGTYGYETVFAITTAGTERVVHSFGHGTDGGEVSAGLIDVNGILYGTTTEGGTYGSGTVCRFRGDPGRYRTGALQL